jgi:DNA helicase-2/ATP-dependent DNA helicase PcrA
MIDKKLNSEQRKAVEHGAGPLMIIAGAGTGKTTVVTKRIEYLITNNLAHPSQILALTFTEKASREMEERIDRVLPYGMTQIWISTFHSFCDRIIRAEGVHVGINPGFTLMNEAETILFFRKHLYKFPLTYFRPLGNPTKFISGMITHFSRLKDEDITPLQYKKWVKKDCVITKDDPGSEAEVEKFNELANVYDAYEALKLKEGVCDYSDLISHALHILRKRPNLLKKYQDQFTYILIDEFQDTNYAQNRLAIMLSGSKQNITVVGDDDQAIYRFRGAAVSNMIEFRSVFPAVKVVVLTKNYRSTKEILDRSYDLISHNNPDRLEIKEGIEKKLESLRRVNGEAIRLIIADRVENEAEAVAKAIVKGKKKGEIVNWRDVAILVRANAHADPFVRALERYQVPFQFLGPGQLYGQAEVKDLIAYLKVLYSYEDTIALYRVLSMSWVKLHARDIATLLNHAKKTGKSLFEVCEESLKPDGLSGLSFKEDSALSCIRRVTTMIHKHLGLLKKETAGQILYFFLKETGLLQEMATIGSEQQERLASNIAKFFDRLKTYELTHEDASVFAIVDWINLSMELGESPLASGSDWGGVDAVHILTVHSSKGLEFPVVFIVNVVSQRFPSQERKEQIPIPDALIHEELPVGDFHLQEERRLFYVAMTRAKDLLYMTGAMYYGDGKREKKISSFVTEAVGREIVEKAKHEEVGETKQLSFLEGWNSGKNEAAPQKKGEKIPISYLSYSQLDSFLRCPLQYKYRYVLKIPVLPSAALSFGQTMHEAVHDFYVQVKSGENPSLEDLLGFYEKRWIGVGYGKKEYEAKMKDHGRTLLCEFYTKGYDKTVVPKELEQPFKIHISENLVLGGKIDRIDARPEGKIEIIDYKTGQSTKVKDVSRDLQLTVYAMAATEQGVYGYRPQDVIVSFYFFENQQKISGTRSIEQLQSARELIAKTAKVMETSDFAPTPGRHCDFCEFRLICEAWK